MSNYVPKRTSTRQKVLQFEVKSMNRVMDQKAHPLMQLVETLESFATRKAKPEKKSGYDPVKARKARAKRKKRFDVCHSHF